MNKEEIHKWVRFGLQVLIIPFGLFVIHSFDNVATHFNSVDQQLALIEQKMDLRAEERSKQLETLTGLFKDHEDRLRVLEHAKQEASRL